MTRESSSHQMFDLGHQQSWGQDERYRALNEALHKGQIVPFYQPIVDSRSRHIVGVEALARWLHPEKGIIPPSEFISFAETSGLIHTIGEHILTAACRQGKAWLDAGYPIDIYVNISSAQLDDPDFPTTVTQVLHETMFPMNLLHLELTEGLPWTHSEAHRTVVSQLKTMGIHLALDDYGTGYASLQCVLDNPFSTVKLDQLFIRHIDVDKRRALIVETVCNLARQLGLFLVAEGVETETQAQFLTENSCPLLQGYLLGRPVPVQEITTRLNQETTDKLTFPHPHPTPKAEQEPNPSDYSVKHLQQKLRDYEWLERCTTPILDVDNVFAVMEAVRNLYQDRFSFDRFGILIGAANDRYCVVNEIVSRDDLELVPAGSLMPIKDTGLQRVYDTGQLHYNPDISIRPEFSEDGHLAQLGVRSLVRIPLLARGMVFGVMTMKSMSADAYAESDLQLMKQAANRLAPSIYCLKLIDSLQEAAYKDGLTGAFNRHFLTEAIANPQSGVVSKLTGLCVQTETSVHVMFIDIDGLKRVNDTHGHVIGDEQLRQISSRLIEVVGDAGAVIRYGGDEFLILLPDATDLFVGKLAGMLSCYQGDDANCCGYSIGVSSGPWSELRSLVKEADTDMYRHKLNH